MIFLLDLETDAAGHDGCGPPPGQAGLLVGLELVSLAVQAIERPGGLALASTGDTRVILAVGRAPRPVPGGTGGHAAVRCRITLPPAPGYCRPYPQLEGTFSLAWDRRPAGGHRPGEAGLRLQWQGFIEARGEGAAAFLYRDVSSGEVCRVGPCGPPRAGAVAVVTALNDSRVRWSIDATPVTPLLWQFVSGLVGLTVE
jgi:hypothetical protein